MLRSPLLLLLSCLPLRRLFQVWGGDQGNHVQERQVEEQENNTQEQASSEGQLPCPYCQEVPFWREQGLSEVLADVMETIDEDPDNQMTAKEIRTPFIAM